MNMGLDKHHTNSLEGVIHRNFIKSSVSYSAGPALTDKVLAELKILSDSFYT
jgi:hypothetical protein